MCIRSLHLTCSLMLFLCRLSVSHFPAEQWSGVVSFIEQLTDKWSRTILTSPTQKYTVYACCLCRTVTLSVTLSVTLCSYNTSENKLVLMGVSLTAAVLKVRCPLDSIHSSCPMVFDEMLSDASLFFIILF